MYNNFTLYGFINPDSKNSDSQIFLNTAGDIIKRSFSLTEFNRTTPFWNGHTGFAWPITAIPETITDEDESVVEFEIESVIMNISASAKDSLFMLRTVYIDPLDINFTYFLNGEMKYPTECEEDKHEIAKYIEVSDLGVPILVEPFSK